MRTFAVLSVIALVGVCSGRGPKEQAISDLVEKTVNDVKDTANDTFNDIKERTKEGAKKTAENITEKSEKLSQELSNKSNSIFQDIGNFISGILGDVAGFIKAIFGDNSPAQPALPPTAGAPAEIRTSKVGLKILMLGALAVLSVLSARTVQSYTQHNKKRDDGDYYRNIQVLEENFL
jgi:hypothetical protein